MAMPPFKRWLEDSKSELERLHRQGAESLVTSSFKQRPPCGTILYDKIVRMIFKKGRIIRG
jgi:hypothetical protein